MPVRAPINSIVLNGSQGFLGSRILDQNTQPASILSIVAEERPVEVDLHMHSHHSKDSLTRPERILECAIRLGLGAIAVTDHNSWGGAREAAKLARGRIIVVPGAELKTDRGDLLALFVEDEIRSRQWTEAVDEIHEKGGLGIVPHPGDSRKLTKEDLSLADGIEVFNSTCSPASNMHALALAKELGKPGVASSDAHMAVEIGNGRTGVEDCASLEELRRRLLQNPTVARSVPSNRFVHFLNASLCFGLKGIWQR